MGYRASAAEPTRRIDYGPFAPAWKHTALVVSFTMGAVLALASAEVAAEVHCWRSAPGAAPTCERSVRKLTSPDVVHVAPAVLRRLGPPGGESDVLEFDGITLMLPNNPPGPFTAFLDTPGQQNVAGDEGVDNAGCYLLGICLVLIAFFLPRALVGVPSRRLVIDRAAGDLVVAPGWFPGEREIVPLAHIASVRVETCGDGFLDRLRGARVVLELVDGAVFPLLPYARPRRGTHLATASVLARALGRDEPVVSALHAPPTSPAARGRILAAQLVSAVLGTVLVAVWFSRVMG
jgi:hypothetical protein